MRNLVERGIVLLMGLFWGLFDIDLPCFMMELISCPNINAILDLLCSR